MSDAIVHQYTTRPDVFTFSYLHNIRRLRLLDLLLPWCQIHTQLFIKDQKIDIIAFNETWLQTKHGLIQFVWMLSCYRKKWQDNWFSKKRFSINISFKEINSWYDLIVYFVSKLFVSFTFCEQSYPLLNTEMASFMKYYFTTFMKNLFVLDATAPRPAWVYTLYLYLSGKYFSFQCQSCVSVKLDRTITPKIS